MKLVCFDVESNGLHGLPFAVGGVVYDTVEKCCDSEILYRADLPDGVTNQWVRDNVLPAMEGVAVTHRDHFAMCDAFWAWLQQHKQDAYVIVDVGYPVESRFLLMCQEIDSLREWEAPYPLHELASILLAAGLDPDMPRFENEQSHLQHNPLEDAKRCAELTAYALSQVRMGD